MDTTELLKLFRTEMRDVEKPYLFADDLVYTYINEAQQMFCRLTQGIEDGRSFKLAVVQGTDWYPINKRILKLRKAYRTDTGREIEIVNQERLGDAGIRFSSRTGPIRVLAAGIQKGMLRAYPMPSEAVEVALDVFRLPSQVGAGDSLEIDEQHHYSLLLWVKHLAYNVSDAETFDRNKAAECDVRFRAYCQQANAEQTRARRQVSPVQYGGL